MIWDNASIPSKHLRYSWMKSDVADFSNSSLLSVNNLFIQEVLLTQK